MIRQKSSQFLGLRMQSELEEPSEVRREPDKDLSSVDESATRMGTIVRTESGTAASLEADHDPAANLFPVRAGQSGPLMNVCKRAPLRASPVVMFTNVRDVFLAAFVKRQGCVTPIVNMFMSST